MNVFCEKVPLCLRAVMLLTIFCLFAGSQAAHAQAGPWVLQNATLQVTVSGSGSYSVAVWNGAGFAPWLVSGETGLSVGGTWYSSPAISGGSLLTGPTTAQSTQSDPAHPEMGAYDAITQSWMAGAVPFVTEFRVYHDHPIIVFEQRFPNGVASSAYANGVSSSFPSFQNSGGKASTLRFLTYNDGFAGPVKGAGLGNIPSVNGQYGADTYGLQGGLPLALLDDSVTSLPTVVLSPLNNFKAGVQTRQNQLGGKLACGIHGQVQSIPPGFTHDTLLYAGTGVNDSFFGWGSTLLGYYGKDRSGPSRDFANCYLGYWTDRGSYYYYSYLNSSNAQTNITDSTLLSIQADHLNRKLPFRNYQLDSWWYFKSSGDSGGTTQWTAQPSRFPATGSTGALNSRMAAAANTTVPFVEHNRYWANNNVYAKPTGLYNFITDPAQAVSNPNDRAPTIPPDPPFWPFLMGLAAVDKNETAVDSNGVPQNDVYEQDWLQYELLKCTPLQKDVSSARFWLQDMGTAATNAGLKIQYCQALGSDYLESVEIPAVTEVRASGDYDYDPNNWRIGGTSLLAWAVGLAPFKDTFWTTTSQPGSHNNIDNSAYTEANPSLQALVATLSAGPVGVGDGIGFTDKTLLMKTCRTDGLLLKPDKPATPIDRSFTSAAPSGEVWATYSDTGSQRWYYVEALGLGAPFNLQASDLGLTGSALVFDTRTGNISPFDSAHPFLLPATNSYDYNYEVIAPLLPSGWALLGETGKFVTLSHQRFGGVGDGGMSATVNGPAGEVVTLVWYGPAAPTSVLADGIVLAQGPDWYYDGARHLLVVNRTLPAGGSSTLHVYTAPANELILQNAQGRQAAFWYTQGSNIVSGAYVTSGGAPIGLPPNWVIVAAGDFNADGQRDLVLSNSVTGQIAFWFTNGSAITSGAYATSNGSPITLPSGWQIVAVGDFNGDGKPDLVLENTSAGLAAIWTMNGTDVTNGAYVTSGGNPIPLPAGWQIVGTGDFNGDGKPDLVVENLTSGQIAFWFTNGPAVTSSAYATSGGGQINAPAGWTIAAVGDYNSDGSPDLVLQNTGSGQLAFWFANGTTITSGAYALSGGAPMTLPGGWVMSGPR